MFCAAENPNDGCTTSDTPDDDMSWLMNTILCPAAEPIDGYPSVKEEICEVNSFILDTLCRSVYLS